ncbi:MAG: 30S ribosomal protein S16 [Halanaerobium sp.]|nr:30S ribosomal protein S16 [Halanaerobium sp.]
MATKIRLRRMGSKRNASYRIVVADSRNSRDGRFIEEIGFYDPTTEPETYNVKEERALDWLDKGAQPSATVKTLFKKAGLMEKFHNTRQ